MDQNKTVRPHIQVVDAQESHFEPIRALCDERYGVGYVTRRTFARWMRAPQLVQVALYDGEFAGFSVMIPHTPQEVAEQMDMPLADVLATTGDKPPLIYKSGAVVLSHEHQGVMSAMAAVGLERAREMGFGALFTSAWEHDGEVPAAGMLQRYAFERLYSRKMIWYHMEEYVCIVCHGRCVCDAVIYQKKL